MNLLDLNNQLASLELSQLAFDVNCDELSDRQKQQIIYALKTALNDLYIKFDLKYKCIRVNFKEGVSVYNITKDHLVGSNVPGTKYLDDSQDTFDDTLLKITGADTFEGKNIPLNDTGNICSVLTPAVDKVIINNTVRELTPEGMVLHYKANHFKIDVDDAMSCPEDVILELPDSHNKALIYNVAGRIYSPMGAVNDTSLGNEYFAKYIEACEQLTNEGIEVYEHNARNPNLFYQKGFV